MTQTIKKQILARLQSHGRGRAFTPKDFLDIANRGSVGRVLAELTDDGHIRRIKRGLYDYPRHSALLGGELSPDIDQAARALARKHRWRILPTPAIAANLLGLSQQVPAKVVYLSDGPSKTVQLGRQTVQFKHASSKTIGVKSHVAGLVIQALRYLGRNDVSDNTIQKLRTKLSNDDKQRLLRDTQYAPDWVHEVAKKIAAGA